MEAHKLVVSKIMGLILREESDMTDKEEEFHKDLELLVDAVQSVSIELTNGNINGSCIKVGALIAAVMELPDKYKEALGEEE